MLFEHELDVSYCLNASNKNGTAKAIIQSSFIEHKASAGNQGPSLSKGGCGTLMIANLQKWKLRQMYYRGILDSQLANMEAGANILPSNHEQSMHMRT
jgi:hypothetical protein